MYNKEQIKKFTKKEINSLLKWAENEIKEWKKFIKILKKQCKRKNSKKTSKN